MRCPISLSQEQERDRGRAHSSVVECLLCKEDALGSNPSGSMSRVRIETVSLKWETALRFDPERTDAPPRASEAGKG